MIWRISLLAILLAGSVGAVTCEKLSHAGSSYSVCSVDPSQTQIRLFLRDSDGLAFGHFRHIEEERGPLAFAMNGGMYHEDRRPVGHFIEDGTEIMRVVPNAGPGNFGMLPNGVFCVREGRADVIETGRYLEETPICRYASQSGPMLVIDGALHARFLPESTSRFFRNGVGTSADGGRAVFVISDTPVTFHEFAVFFRDVMDVPNALFLDGNVSRLHAPSLGRSDIGFRMGPVVGVLEADVEAR